MADHHQPQHQSLPILSAVSLCLMVVTLSVVMVRMVVVRLWWRPRRTEAYFSRQGIRGPAYRFLTGNAREIEEMMVKASSKPIQPPSPPHNILPRVLPFYHHWKKIYGAAFLVWFGPTARLTVSDPELIREVLVSKPDLYEKVEPHPLVKELEGDGLLSLRGEKWALHRRIVSPAFLVENLKLLVPAMLTSAVNMLDKWEERSRTRGDGGDSDVEIEVSEWFQTLMEDVICRAAFGSESHEDAKLIFQLQSQQMALAAEAFQKIFIPGYRYLPFKRNVKSWILDRTIRRSLKKLVHCRKVQEDMRGMKDNHVNNGGRCRRELLGVMIDGGLSSGCMDEGEIVEECKTFFFAGKQTTSNLLTWTTVVLAMHPSWQDVAREEVLTVCGARGSLPSKDHVPKLKKLTMIINESLRLYPPAIAMIRRATSNVCLGGCKIPRGTELLIPVLAVHHDQAVWGSDAIEFNPARFSNDSAGSRGRPGAFIPFGLGVRTCIGQNLALLQAKLTLALMLQRFSFRLAPSYRHAPTVLMMLHPQYGAPIVFTKLGGDPPT
ncbi:hypothetical protein SAY87_002045 [Trapa incisa]|uniref:Cytochrome P450 734A1 n=1 Tax=Trapa incisa TaxID=236973 RepID=A0AAN7JUA4_9MYRT|nr:hypothetical protein SAY87_002045 [Trapa incisa]